MSKFSMKIATRLILVSALLIAVVSFASPGLYTGQWFVDKDSDRQGDVHLQLRFERHTATSNWNSSHSYDTPIEKLAGLTPALLSSAGEHGQFKVVRDAGTFNCDGWFANGKGSGTFTFEPSAQYAQELQKQGVGTPSEEQQLRLAMSDSSLELVGVLKQAGYSFDVEDLIRVSNHGVTLSYIREINALGYHPSEIRGLVRLRDHGVTPEYIKAIQSSGLKNLPAEELVRLRDHGVTPDYINGLAKNGINDLDAESLVRLRDHGVDPEYIAAMRKTGYKADPEELTRMRDHGVDPEYVQDLAAQNVKDLSTNDLVRLRDHGVSAEFVASVRKTGLQASADDLTRLRDHGVSSDFIAEVRAAGFTDLRINDYTRLRDHGVDVQYLKQHGKGRSIDQVIHMHDRGGENEVL